MRVGVQLGDAEQSRKRNKKEVAMRGKNLVWLIVSLILVGALMLVSCGGPAAPTEVKATRMTFAGGSIGGTLNLLGNCFAGLMKKNQNIDLTVLTFPTAQTPVVLGEGGAELCGTNSQQSYDPFVGKGISEGKPFPALREILPHQVTQLQIFVLADSPYKTFRDLVGKRVSGGTKGMGPESYLTAGLPAIGLDWNKDFDIQYMSHQEGGSNLVSGKIAAYMASSEPPHPTLAQFDLTKPLRLIGFTKADGDAIAKSVPGLATLTIPAKFYHMTEPALSVTAMGHALSRSDVSEDVIYGLVKGMISDPEFVGYYSETFKLFILNQEAGTKAMVEASPSATTIPFHKGALRYYQEIGWKVPAERIPAEAK